MQEERENFLFFYSTLQTAKDCFEIYNLLKELIFNQLHRERQLHSSHVGEVNPLGDVLCVVCHSVVIRFPLVVWESEFPDLHFRVTEATVGHACIAQSECRAEKSMRQQTMGQKQQTTTILTA